MTSPWIPLSARGKQEDSFDALLEGVPHHLKNSLWNWLDKRFHYVTSTHTAKLHVELLRQFERQKRQPVPWSTKDWETWSNIQHTCFASDELFLDLTDFALAFALRQAFEAKELDRILHEAGSAWVTVHRPSSVEEGAEGG